MRKRIKDNRRNKMKKLLFIAVMLTAIASTTKAQWYVYRNSAENSNWVRAYTGITYGSVKETINGQSLSFNPIGAVVGAVLSPNLTFNTLKRMPLFLEVGVEFSYAYGHTTDCINLKVDKQDRPWEGQIPFANDAASVVKADGTPYEASMSEVNNRKLNMMTASIPVNITYCFDFIPGQLTLAPYLGAAFKFNLMSQWTIDDQKIGMIKDEHVNVFQVAGQAGFNVIIVKGFSVGYRFQYDFMHYAYSTTTNNHSLQFGYRF